MYNPPESGNDSMEYIELFNTTNAPINLLGYQLIGVGFTFDNVTIPALGFRVVAKNPAVIQSQFSFAGALQWPTTEALNNGGELLQLLNAAGAVVDSVRYDDNLPWDVNANGNGSSIELCDAAQDNGVATYWVASAATTGAFINGKALAGSPGTANQTPCPAPPEFSVANNDSFTLPFGQTATFDVLVNDVIVNPPATIGLPATIFELGTLLVINNQIQFTPNGQCGTAVFSYYLEDQLGIDSANVTVNIACPIVYPIYTIGQVKGINAEGVADSTGVFCELTATVHGVNLRSTGLQFYMIDDSNNGIAVFRNNNNFGYTVNQGDKLAVRGQIVQFAGLIQMVADTVWKISSNNPLQTPQVVSGMSETTESQLIKFECLFMNPTQWDTTGNPGGFNLSLPNGQTIRIDNDVAMFYQTAPFTAVSTVSITGIGSQFDNSTPYTEGYQLIPMFPADFQICASTVDAAAVGFSVSPNPAIETITFNLPMGATSLKIYNNDGRLIYNEVAKTVDVRTWPAGAYHILIRGSFGSSSLRFIKL